MWRAQLHRRKPRAAQRENSGAGGSRRTGTALLPENQPGGRGPLGSAPLSLRPGQGHGSASAGFWPPAAALRALGEGKAAVPPAGDKGTDGGTPPMGKSTIPHQCVWHGLGVAAPRQLPAMAVLSLQSSEYRGVSYTKRCQQKPCCCSTFFFFNDADWHSPAPWDQPRRLLMLSFLEHKGGANGLTRESRLPWPWGVYFL